MKIIYHDGPEQYETAGQGVIERDVERDMDDAYAQGLIDQGIVEATETPQQIEAPAVTPAAE